MKTDIANGFKNSQSVFLVCSSLTTSPTMFDSNTALPQSTQYGVYYLSGKQDSKLATVVVMRSGMEMMSTDSVRVVQLLAIHPTARSRARSWLNYVIMRPKWPMTITLRVCSDANPNTGVGEDVPVFDIGKNGKWKL